MLDWDFARLLAKKPNNMYQKPLQIQEHKYSKNIQTRTVFPCLDGRGHGFDTLFANGL